MVRKQNAGQCDNTLLFMFFKKGKYIYTSLHINYFGEKQNKALVTVLSPGRGGKKAGAGSRHMRNPFNFVQYACVSPYFSFTSW